MLLPTGVLVLALLWAPWPFGSVTPWAAALLMITGLSAFVLSFAPSIVGAPGLAALRPVAGPAGALALLALLGWIQAATWPAGLTAVVSPEHLRLAVAAAAAGNGSGGGAGGGVPWSVAPAASIRTALLLLSLSAYLGVAAFVGRRRSARRLLAAALLAGALGQLFFGAPRWFRGSSTLWGAEIGGGGRLRGSFVNPNHFALFLEIALAVAFAWGFWAARRAAREQAPERKVLLVAPPVLVWFVLFAGVAFSGSRGGLAAAVGATVVQGLLVASITFRHSRARGLAWALSGTAVAVLGVAVVVFIGMEEGLGRLADTSAYDLTWSARLDAYGATLELWRLFPWLGSGLGTFIDVFPMVQPGRLEELWRHTHNDALELLVTGGLVGVTAAVLGLILLVHRLVRGLRFGTRTEDRAAAVAALGALAAASAHDLLDFALTMPAVAVSLTIVLGAACAAASRGDRGRGGRGR
ncbi:MAG: O-antigen ligase family protein [Acidobacteriota bacterium]